MDDLMERELQKLYNELPQDEVWNVVGHKLVATIGETENVLFDAKELSNVGRSDLKFIAATHNNFPAMLADIKTLKDTVRRMQDLLLQAEHLLADEDANDQFRLELAGHICGELKDLEY